MLRVGKSLSPKSLNSSFLCLEYWTRVHSFSQERLAIVSKRPCLTYLAFLKSPAILWNLGYFKSHPGTFYSPCPLTYELIGIEMGPIAYTFQNNSKFFWKFFQRLGRSLTMALNSKKDQILNSTKGLSYSEGVLTVRIDWVWEGLWLNRQESE